MKRTLLLLGLTVFCAACTRTDAVSNRTPRGSANATVLVEEFADLECPACRSAHTAISAPILEKYGKDIRFEFKHFPLRSIHRFALDAAEMSECAADQGKFWEFVDMNYEQQEKLSMEVLTEWAEEIGLDVTKAERCWKSHSKRSVVLNDYKEGRERDVSGTPTYFVNGVKIQSGFDTLEAAIQQALKGSTMPL